MNLHDTLRKAAMRIREGIMGFFLVLGFNLRNDEASLA
jgi:hypothetical protein